MLNNHTGECANEDCACHALARSGKTEGYNDPLLTRVEADLVVGAIPLQVLPEGTVSDEWHILETITRTSVVNQDGKDIAVGLGRGAKQRREHATQIVNDHNQHQQCASQLQFLGDRLEAQAKQMAHLAGENERLREALQWMLSNFSPYPCEDTERWREEWEACEDARLLLIELNHAARGEGR